MAIHRDKNEWQRFVDLLPDKLERDELMMILVPVKDSGVDMDLVYSAIASGIEAKRTEEHYHEVLTKSKPFIRQVNQAREMFLDLEQYFKRIEQKLSSERKAAFRHYHRHTSEPYDLALQKLREGIEIIETQVVPEARTGRREGNQPHEYARSTDERMKAAGIRSYDYRDRLLRVYGLKPHRKL